MRAREVKACCPLLFSLVALVGMLAPVCFAQEPAADPAAELTQPSPFPTLLAIGRVVHTDGTLVLFDLDRQVDWGVASAAEDHIELEFENTRQSQGLADRDFDDGLISRISTHADTTDSVTLVARIETREPCFFRTERRGDSIELQLRTALNTSRGGRSRIAPGDKLNVDVFGTSELDAQPRVATDGRIALPLLGRFEIAGLTAEEAEKRIADLLRSAQLVSNPQVFVTIEETALGGISVQGAVNRPGIYPARGDLSLLEILGLAGGMNRGRQSSDQIVVIRRDRSGLQSRLEIAATGLIDRGDLSLNISILPGDIVMVPESKVFTVHVTGAVRRPGAVEFLSSEGISVLQAITLAGGASERAKLSKVSIIRRLPGGEQETLWVDIKKIRTGKKRDIALLPGDTVVLREWFL